MGNQDQPRKSRSFLWLPVLLAAVAVTAAIVARWWQSRRLKELPPRRPPAPPAIPPDLHGLTEAEAEARRLEGQDNAIPFRPPRSRHVILRDNLYTIFNLNLIGLASAQFLLGLTLDALISMGMIVVNAALNIAQEMLARIRLRELEEATRLQATVIREGKVRSINPNEIVQGDVLVVGPGDQLLVDGQLIGEGQIAVDESMLTGESGRTAKHTGDNVYAGSLCLSGRAAYEAQTVGSERLIIKRLTATQAGKEELTPLEHVIDRILRILLVVVVGLTGVLLARHYHLDLGVDPEVLGDAVSVIFSIAPAGLFFMIFLTYAAGTADLAKLGALVHRARSVESLAEATTVCFAEAGILTGTHVEIEPMEPPAGQVGLAESRIRQILGDYARSTSLDSLVTRAMAATFEGSRRVVKENAPFLSAYGWSAVAFDDDDLRGIYVLGDPDILEEHLLKDEEESIEAEPEGSRLAALRERLPSPSRLLRRFRKPAEQEDRQEDPEGVTTPVQRQEVEPANPLPASRSEPDATALPGNEAPSKNPFRRLLARARRVLPGSKEEAPPAQTVKDLEVEETVLLFAYHPESRPLHAADGSFQIPEGMRPLCTLRYAERVRPEALETIQAFSKMGLAIKVLSSGKAERTVAILSQAGLGTDSGLPLHTISGEELANLDRQSLARAVREAGVFGNLSPEQAGLVVQALRQQGQVVTVVGDRVNDLPAMRQANLAVARHSSSQAVLSRADIVLLKDSPEALLDVLNKGQRIVNGLLDVLKLYLTQMLYLTLLIVSVRLFSSGFPYLSKQGSAISILTLSLPAAALSLWASHGILTTRDLRWLLARFVVPASITIGAAGLVVYSIFLQRSGDIAYAQLALTYTLVGIGLLLVLFVRPPSRLWVGGTLLSGDRRFTVAVAVLLVLFLVASGIPLAHQFLGLARLQQPLDYLVIGIAIVGWAILLRTIWWVIPLAAKSERPTRHADKSS